MRDPTGYPAGLTRWLFEGLSRWLKAAFGGVRVPFRWLKKKIQGTEMVTDLFFSATRGPKKTDEILFLVLDCLETYINGNSVAQAWER